MPEIKLSSNALAIELKAELTIAANGDNAQHTRQHAVRRIIITIANQIVQLNKLSTDRTVNATFNRPQFYVRCGLTPNGELIP